MTQADFANASARYPSTQMNEAEWIAVFDANRDMMWQILADTYNVIQAEHARSRGDRTSGRRPRRRAASLEQLLAAVFPQRYTNDPFPVALADLIAGRSQRQFAARVPCNQSTLSRLINGGLEPDLVMLERVAAAANVPAHYFLEWRAHYLGQLVTHVFMQRPDMSVAALRKLRHWHEGGASATATM